MVSTTPELESFIARLDDPDWLLASRRAAAAIEATSGAPRWDRTDASRLEPAAFALRGGGSVSLRLPEAARGQGVLAAELGELARREPQRVQAHLGRVVPASAGRHEARNLAAHHGCLVHVPAGVVVAEPIEVTYRLDGGQFHPRTVVVLERGAEATVLQRVAGGPPADGEPALVTAVVEAELADGARLRYIELQQWGEGVAAYATRQAVLGRDANVQWLLGEIGGGIVRASTTSVLVGAGSEALALLVFFAAGRQHLDLAATLLHHGEHTNGLLLAKGVLAGTARTVYRGISDIRRGAKGSDSQQKENTLHLGHGVRSDAIPALYIDENDLQAGHAATTGKVDPEQLFYLQSRGLPLREAERLIVHGFFAPLLERVPLESVRQELTALVDAKIDRGLVAH